MRAFLLALLLVAPAAQAAPSLQVFVSILPQETFLARLGEPHVRVEALVRPGFSPHTYEPTPQQMARLAAADLYVRIGVPFEAAWDKRIRGTNPRLAILDPQANLDLSQLSGMTPGPGPAAPPDAAQAIQSNALRPHAAAAGVAVAPVDPVEVGKTESDEAKVHTVAADPTHAEHDAEHDHGELDPHIWTSPPLVKQMAVQIVAALIRLDPAHRADYQENLRRFSAELEALDAEIRTRLADLDDRRFMVFHPAWGYFAATYGLEQVPIEREGKSPGPRRLAALIEQARREQIRIILVQPQFPTEAAAEVAKAIEGRVVPIDPLSRDYAATLRALTQAIAGAHQDGGNTR